MSRRILYIDDNPHDQRLVEKMLTPRGYELLLASDGPGGVALAAEQQPDLILIDVQMPLMDGLETARKIRELAPCAETPIVALTAHADKYKREQYLAAGFTDYQQKQAGIQPLLVLVRRFMSE